MKSRGTWLVAWGSAADQIRFGYGDTEEAAMKYAFGMTNPNMTALRIPAADAKVHKRRKEHIRQLLIKHQQRFISEPKLYERYEGEKVVAAIAKELKEIGK